MPSVSGSQQRFMGADLARARAGQPTVSGMDPTQLADFAGTPTAGLPEKKRPKHRKKHGGPPKGGGPGMIGAGRQPKPRGGSFY